jgi:hypothetical protein
MHTCCCIFVSVLSGFELKLKLILNSFENSFGNLEFRKEKEFCLYLFLSAIGLLSSAGLLCHFLAQCCVAAQARSPLGSSPISAAGPTDLPSRAPSVPPLSLVQLMRGAPTTVSPPTSLLPCARVGRSRAPNFVAAASDFQGVGCNPHVHALL